MNFDDLHAPLALRPISAAVGLLLLLALPATSSAADECNVDADCADTNQCTTDTNWYDTDRFSVCGLWFFLTHILLCCQQLSPDMKRLGIQLKGL